eukprot:TRINITY_DN54855_c0_g1_i1.p1 TRINITY_DN54855_c0_g1~~TRINITY_DN54855_c0_g1_i1.p1  ORF type:complete len:164 (-),score=20.72 TRINITY_DN54855_c0_g1_i1:130-621(-)
MGVHRLCLCAICFLAGVGDASSESFDACIQEKSAPAMAVCGRELRCSAECESAVNSFSEQILVCCAELPVPARWHCDLRYPKMFRSRYESKCLSFVDDFTAALMKILPFGNYHHEVPVAAVAKDKIVRADVLVIGAAIAGAAGASVAMVVASYIVRKQVLLPN